MKNITTTFISLIMFANISYSSFPVFDFKEMIHDTLQKKEINEYHSNLIKMGFNLNDCKCSNCRKGNSFQNNEKINQSNATGLYILSGVILLGVIVWLSVGLIREYNCLDNRSNCKSSSNEGHKEDLIAKLGLMSLLALIGLGIAFKARLMQIRNKKDNSKNSFKVNKTN
ncbi:MAG: hypothetical protein CMD14_00410 [Flavobacteriales bacterium]|mgnify:CR=1 FL=1|nr:hypothetical protein [Flavobacteriales bacterium]|tara:strand:- start:29275 stop:29784 length:510 start_codon:yes stop_codon:yes gene_type:complete